MQQYSYIARGRQGKQVTGQVAAETVDDARRLIREQALFPVKIEQSKLMSLRKPGGKRVGSRLLVKFYAQLADLMTSGVPLLRCFDVLKRQSNSPRLAEVLSDIRDRLADGSTLADAMAHHERVFGELSISMVRAGQEGGFIEDVFRRIAVFTERQEDLRSRVIGALAYPVFLLLIGTGIITVLLIFFVPKFAQVFDRLRERGELPAATEGLLAFSQALQSYGLFIAAGIVAAFYFLRHQAETPAGRRFLDTWKLRLPIFGSVVRDLAITRFNRVLGTLRKNGVPILASLRIAKDSTGNVLMKEAIDQAADNVQAGDKLATPLRASGVFPLEIVEMIEVAEESNNLENVLLDSADSLEKQTTRQMELAVRLLEPMLLLVMAAVVLVVVVALLLPIFKMSSTIS